MYFFRFCDSASNILAELVRTARINEFYMSGALGTVTCYGMDDGGIVVRFPGGVTDLSHPQIVQIGSGVHLSSSPVVTGDHFCR